MYSLSYMLKENIATDISWVAPGIDYIDWIFRVLVNEGSGIFGF